MRFWDSSALFPLCFEERRTAILKALYESDLAVTTWWASSVECQSALARVSREGRLNAEQQQLVHSSVRELAAVWTEIGPSEEVRRLAVALLWRYPLRAADALQLAAALIWAGQPTEGQAFVSLDDRLREAAGREGFDVLPVPV